MLCCLKQVLQEAEHSIRSQPTEVVFKPSFELLCLHRRQFSKTTSLHHDSFPCFLLHFACKRCLAFLKSGNTSFVSLHACMMSRCFGITKYKTSYQSGFTWQIMSVPQKCLCQSSQISFLLFLAWPPLFAHNLHLAGPICPSPLLSAPVYPQVCFLQGTTNSSCHLYALMHRVRRGKLEIHFKFQAPSGIQVADVSCPLKKMSAFCGDPASKSVLSTSPMSIEMLHMLCLRDCKIDVFQQSADLLT